MLMKPQEDQETKEKGVSSAVEQWLVQKVHSCTGHHLLNICVCLSESHLCPVILN